MNDQKIDDQKINEMLAKGTKTEKMPPYYRDTIDYANQYLVERKGEKPDWLDAFLESNRRKLVETICRATSAAQGISSLQGYSEGYFNEIVQNANDLHYGESMEFSVSQQNGKYSLACKYEDNGFLLSNIYAFLNREMSDKSESEEQTGKFGVGIKSFFKFVDSFKIESNILFDFTIQRKPEDEDNDISGETYINENWNGKNTVLSITYNPEYNSSFNTKKLTDLIDYLCGDNDNIDVLSCFLTGSDEKLVFDIRSLIFMMIPSGDKKNISKLKFRGAVHNVEISCIEEKEISDVNFKGEEWRTGLIALQMSVDPGSDHESKYEKRYIVFSHKDISMAFLVGEELENKANRMYATYYLKTDSENKILPMGMLIDTKYANIHRNDVGDSDKTINDVYNEIRDYLNKLYGFMCSEEAAKLPCADEISDAFHSIVYESLKFNEEKYPETPLWEDIDYDKDKFNARLPKIRDEKARSYVIVHKDNEKYDHVSFKEEHPEEEHQKSYTVKELQDNYFKYIEKDDAYDLLPNLLNNENCILGVKRLYSALSGYDHNVEIPEQNRKIAERIVNYFGTVEEFLAYAISGERRKGTDCVTDAEIDNWLFLMEEKAGTDFDPQLFLKYVGRYDLNKAIKDDGSIEDVNLSFRDYLFNEKEKSIERKGYLAQKQNEFYDKKYSQLKKELLEKRYTDTGNKENPYMIRCIRPQYGSKSYHLWDGTYDYYDEMTHPDNSDELSDPLLLLERMTTDPEFITGFGLDLDLDLDYASPLPQLFEKHAKNMRYRSDRFRYFEIDKQQIICLSCIRNIELKSFQDFISAIKYRKDLPPDPSNLKGLINITCCEDMDTRYIAGRVLPEITGDKTDLLDEIKLEKDKIKIKKITENSNNEMPAKNIDFILKWLIISKKP